MTTPRDHDPALHVRSAPQGRIPDFSPVTDAMRTLEGACPPPWAMYQDRRFLEICTRHYGWALADWSGILGVERRLPGVGGLRGRVWSPEARAPGTWAQALADSGVGILDVITNEAVDHPGFQRTSPADLVSMIVRIEDDLDAMFAGFEKRLRNGIKKGMHAGMAIELGEHPHELEAFHRLLVGITQGGVRYEVPPMPVLDALHQERIGRLYLARWHGQIVGGLFVLGGLLTHGFVSGFDPSACDGLPSSLLYWDAIRAESARGCRYLDLGAQSPAEHPSLTLAKRGFRPIHVPAYRYTVVASAWRARLMRGIDRLRGRST